MDESDAPSLSRCSEETPGWSNCSHNPRGIKDVYRKIGHRKPENPPLVSERYLLSAEAARYYSFGRIMHNQTSPRLLRFLISISLAGVALAAFASRLSWGKIVALIGSR